MTTIQISKRGRNDNHSLTTNRSARIILQRNHNLANARPGRALSANHSLTTNRPARGLA